MKKALLPGLCLAVGLAVSGTVMAQDSKGSPQDDLNDVMRSFLTKTLRTSEVRQAIGAIVDDAFPSHGFIVEPDEKNKRFLLVDPLQPDAPAWEFYSRGAIKGNFTDPDHPQILIGGSLRDPSDDGLTIDRSYAVLERRLARNGWDEPYTRLMLNGFDDKTSESLLCCKFEGVTDSDADHSSEIRMSRYVRYVGDATKGDFFYKETFSVVFLEGKPALFGKIESEKTDLKPEEVTEYLVRDGLKDTIYTPYGDSLSQTERIAKEKKIKEEKIRALEELHIKVSEIFQTLGIISTTHTIDERGIAYTITKETRVALEDPLIVGQIRKVINDTYGPCNGSATCEVRDESGSLRYKITGCNESSNCID